MLYVLQYNLFLLTHMICTISILYLLQISEMHAILTNPDLAGVVAWAPHGRSWRILRPRDFEIRILPKYFEHSKFSSFVRQANGWGFRRLMADGGRLDKNEYYHEYFLRAMPWLCKKMRRPKVNEKSKF